MSKNITLEDLDKYFKNVSKNTNEQEINQKRLIQNLDKFKKVFDEEFEKALKKLFLNIK